MNIKTDTKEKFTVITPQEATLSANMTDELSNLLLSYLQKDIPHIVLKMNEVKSIDNESAEKITMLQQQFYEKNCSFVICELTPEVEEIFDKEELLEVMNITPTESEAWDILQMEEIERELFSDEENDL
jgi:anti-anti-sigma factor